MKPVTAAKLRHGDGVAHALLARVHARVAEFGLTFSRDPDLHATTLTEAVLSESPATSLAGVLCGHCA